MEGMDWKRYKGAFKPDGALRDVYVKDTSAKHWSQFHAFLLSGGYPLRYSRRGESAALPEDFVRLIGHRVQGHLLTIDLGGVLLNCHFFLEDEIELDFHPEDVTSAEDLGKVFSFMRALGEYLERPVILTPENMDEEVWFRHVPGATNVECVVEDCSI
jgi:hypothetical protein